MRRLFTPKLFSTLMSAVALVTLVVGFGPLSVVSAASPGQNNAEGGIVLYLQNVPAVTPWVGVQWQDPSGGWHDIDAWVGPYDVASSPFGGIVHWVDPRDFGIGPFRWIVWDTKQDGNVLAMSSPFWFPTFATVDPYTINLAPAGQ